MIRKLARSVREFKTPTILTLIFIVGEVFLEILLPFITSDLVNSVKAGTDMNTILKLGLQLILMAFLSLGCGAVAAVTCGKASTGFARNLRRDLFAKIQSFSFENIDKFSTSSLVTRLTTDVSNVHMSFMMLIRTAIRSPLMLIFAVIMAFRMGGKLAVVFVLVIPILAGGLYLVARKAMPAFHKVFKRYDKLNESIEENVQSMRAVKGFSREEYEKEKFDKAADSIRDEFVHAERIVALNNPLMQLCMNIVWIVVLFFGSRIVITTRAQQMDVGQISALLTYGVQVLMSLMMLSFIYVMLTMSIESARRICEVLDEQPTLVNPEHPVTEIRDGSVVFDNVSFKYSATAQRNSLENVSLTIRSGMTVGVIGGTGSSKTTLVQLIPRLYDVSSGSVKVGGRDVREYDLDALRGAVAMVLQKNQLFAGTIKENLRWGNENATDEELEEACRLACADEFVQTFPDKYDTHIEQGGTNVSGGQKQRLCIARALLKKPKILILDDSTSAVDTRTDAIIRAGFRSYIPETTKIIIAQRIASVQEADMIIVLDNGAVSAVGTHEELLKTSVIYREVYEQQTNAGKEESENA